VHYHKRDHWARFALYFEVLGINICSVVNLRQVFFNIYKYHLSLINLRDRIELWTEVDDHCNKLSVDSRGSGGVVNLVD